MLLLLPLFVLTGCHGGEEFPLEVNKTLEGDFSINDTVVGYGVKCRLYIPLHSASVVFYDVLLPGFGKVKELSLASLSCVLAGDDYIISADVVVPVVDGEAATALTMTNVSAVYRGGKFDFSAETQLGNVSFTNAVSKEFKGTLVVGDYKREAVIAVREKQALGVADILFNDVKFSPLMPVTIDITVKDISCYTGGNFDFNAEDIIPYINKEEKPQSKYKFEYISGTIMGNKLVLMAKMADDLAFYVSGKEFEFTGILNE